MKKSKLLLSFLALAILSGVSGAANAGSHGYRGMNMPPEQYAAMQEAYAEAGRTIQPLEQQLYARQAELDALYYKDIPQSDPKSQALIKEIGELEAKLYAARSEMRAKLGDKGFAPGRGAWHGGYGRGMHGPRGNCCW
ncbi:MAG: hypothetical protein LBB60_09475 [Desulfovibrio sp.]|jgi:Skp family chaperone for outer membrane proteins|nr:hypothetical protein [Desulfovibrio sp.]